MATSPNPHGAHEHVATSEACYQAQREALIELTRWIGASNSEPATAFRHITETAARTLRVARVSIWRFDRDRRGIRCKDLFDARGLEHSAGAELAAQSCPAYFEALGSMRALPVEDVQNDPRVCELLDDYLRPLNIGAMLDAPIYVGGAIDGVLCHEHVGEPRTWTHDEITFAAAIANLVSLSLESRERQKAEEEVRSFQSRFELFGRATSDAVWDWDLLTNELSWNAGFESMFGFLRKDIESSIDSWYTRIHPDDAAKVISAVHRVIDDGGEHWAAEYRFRRHDGSYAPVLDRGYVIRDKAGAPARMIGCMVDLTERKRAEQEIERQATFAQLNPNPVLEINRIGVITYFNESAQQMADALGLGGIGEMLPVRTTEIVGECLDSRTPQLRLEVEVSNRTLSWSFFPIAVNDAVHVYGGDITERKQAEDRLREQASLLDKARDAIVVRDLQHHILYWNKSAERLYGWTAAEVIGASERELLYLEPDQYDAAAKQLLVTDEWVGELEQTRKEGGHLIIEGHWTLVRDAQGQPKSILAINTDITEQKNLERQFLRAQRLESIGTLAGGIAHDLNNILTPITMAVDLLNLTVTDPKSQEVLSTVAESAKRGASIVSQVLSFARGVEGARVEVHLRQLMEELTQMMQETFPKSLRMDCSCEPMLWPIVGDPTQVHQVLLNLCLNARDAMPEGGRLTLQAENVAVDAQYAAMNLEAHEGPHVAVTVTDTGTGIAPEHVEKIFDPFFTTKELGKGTGLGLSTSTAIVKSHGGFITLDTEVGKGTRFRVFFPAAMRTASPPAEVRTSGRRHGSGELILLVDDEESVRQITQRTLETYGYQVITACDGAEAVARFAQHRDGIAVVLTDMMMPVMDGAAAIRVITRMNPAVRIIAASGITATNELARAAGASVKRFLRKPYTAEMVLEALDEVLRGDAPAA